MARRGQHAAPTTVPAAVVPAHGAGRGRQRVTLAGAQQPAPRRPCVCARPRGARAHRVTVEHPRLEAVVGAEGEQHRLAGQERRGEHRAAVRPERRRHLAQQTPRVKRPYPAPPVRVAAHQRRSERPTAAFPGARVGAEGKAGGGARVRTLHREERHVLLEVQQVHRPVAVAHRAHVQRRRGRDRRHRTLARAAAAADRGEEVHALPAAHIPEAEAAGARADEHLIEVRVRVRRRGRTREAVAKGHAGRAGGGGALPERIRPAGDDVSGGGARCLAVLAGGEGGVVEVPGHEAALVAHRHEHRPHHHEGHNAPRVVAQRSKRVHALPHGQVLCKKRQSSGNGASGQLSSWLGSGQALVSLTMSALQEQHQKHCREAQAVIPVRRPRRSGRPWWQGPRWAVACAARRPRLASGCPRAPGRRAPRSRSRTAHPRGTAAQTACDHPRRGRWRGEARARGCLRMMMA